MAQQTATERNDLSMPPGPRGLPIIGSMLSLRKNPHHALTRIARKYGDVCTVRLGSVPTIVISHPTLLRDAFSRVTLADRWLSRITEALTNGEDLAFAPYGEYWRQLQRFANRELLSYRRVQDIRERYIEDSVNGLVARVDEMCDAGVPLEPRDFLPRANGEMMFRAIFGRGESDTAEFNEKLDDLLETVFWFFANANAANPADYIPALKFLPNRALEEAQKVSDQMSEILDFLIDKVKERPNLNLNEPSCLAEVMLASVETEEITHETMRSLIGDLLVAGIDTTAQTTSWLLLILANRQHIQDRVHEELKAAVGADGLPGMEHQASLPYLHAIILESMRYRTVGPLGLPHKAIEDVELDGFVIPKDAQVLGNIYAIHHDPRFWESPDEFIPERFMSVADGAPPPALTSGAFMPFGTGRRGCPGQGFAEIVIWLQACRLLHKYRFTPHGTDRLPEDEVFGLAISPIPYALDIERR
ncbi:MAG: cytochrome P450 [Chloroflexi bacterium]|nr:cytochrome P450 [Chloroflexota bacterium]